MERSVLLTAIDDLKSCDNIEHSIDCLKELAVDFCNHYECDFNTIRDSLEDLSPFIEVVNSSREIAYKCSQDLY